MSEFDAMAPDDNVKLKKLLSVLNEITGADELANKKRAIIEQLNAIEVKIDNEKYLDYIIKSEEPDSSAPKTQAEIVNEVYGWQDVLSDRMEIESALKKLNLE